MLKNKPKIIFTYITLGAVASYQQIVGGG